MANLKRGQPFYYFVSQKSFDTALARNLSSVYEREDSKGEELGNKVQVLLYHWYHHTHVYVSVYEENGAFRTCLSRTTLSCGFGSHYFCTVYR